MDFIENVIKIKKDYMKITVVTDVVTRRAGGVFNAVRDMFTSQIFSTQHIEILSYQDDFVDKDISSWKNLPMKLFKPHFFLYSKNLRDTLCGMSMDIYHQEGLWRYSHLLMGKVRKRSNVPIVCTPHGMLDPYIIRAQGTIKRVISNLFFQKSFEAVTCYQALCQKEMEDIRAYGLKQPIAIIPNGINLPDTSKRYSRNDNLRHLLFLGRLHHKKGVDLLLRAFSNVLRANKSIASNWHIDLVGWDHENCKRQLQKIVTDNDIDKYVTFHGGLYGDDKMRMYATCDAYILPSHGEGLPMTVLEAWSWRKPVLITPHCHLPEGYDVHAAIYIEDNVESIQKGLEKLFCMNEDEMKEMGNNGFRLVESNFTWDVSAKKLLQTYNWLLGRIDKPDFIYEYEFCNENYE